jgi:hypothetical protein
MKAALDRLGFGPCHHMFEIMSHPEQVDRWLPLAIGSAVDWNGVLAGYRSTQDWPASHFYRELADAYPDAKVVLTVRDPHAWYPSLRTLLQRGAAMIADEQARATSPVARTMSRLTPVLELVGRAYFGPEWTVAADLPDEDACVAVFDRHVAAVKAAIAPERLLVFDVREGWSPLCAFLDVPVPADEPFPHLNDTDWMRQAMTRMHEDGIAPTPFAPGG